MLITEASATSNQNQRKDHKELVFKYTHQWNNLDEEQLKHLFHIHQGNWKSISKSLNGPSPLECMRRWQRLHPNQTLSRQLWSKEEDEQLKELVQKYGKKWSKICTVMNWRTGKQVRERYLNQLQVHINNERWTDQEDRKILKLYKKYGTKWSYISSLLNGRPENMVKNRFYATLKRKFQRELDDEKQSQDSLDSIDQNQYKKKKKQKPYKDFSQIKKCQLKDVNSQIFKRVTRSNNNNTQQKQIKEENDQEQIQLKKLNKYQQSIEQQELEIKSISQQQQCLKDEIISNNNQIPNNPIMQFTRPQGYNYLQVGQQQTLYCMKFRDDENKNDFNQSYPYYDNNQQYHLFIQPLINNNYISQFMYNQQFQQYTNQIFQ